MQRFSGLEYLKIDIANQFGLDKEMWEERIDWVDTNINTLEAHMDYADNPILYIKAVQALRDTEAGIPTGFIMGLDSTASGLQIMALLSGCPITAANVNLTNTGKREDIYEKVSNVMNQLPNVNVDRGIIKKPLMTTFYGSMARPKQIFGEDTVELSAFYSTLMKELPGAFQLLGDIQSWWNPTALEHSWSLPDGHVVHAKVLAPVDKKIEVDELNHATFTFRTTANIPQEHGLSLAANIVHSVDAYIVREMVRRTHARGIQLATIHDCFYACPNDMDIIRLIYIQIMMEIAKLDLMQDILREITGNPTYVYTKVSNNLSNLISKSEYALS